MLTQMPISCDVEDRRYFEYICKKREITKRQFIHELIKNHKINSLQEGGNDEGKQSSKKKI